MTQSQSGGTAKPFIKWAGGKGQLLAQLDTLLPADFAAWPDACYVEPFVGGGAMLFHLLRRYPNISRAVVNDANAALTTCYRTVRDSPDALIAALAAIERDFLPLVPDARKAYYLLRRARFNTAAPDDVERTALFIFLNRTCFNGLYRVNRRGAFNVPFGRYARPVICDEATLRADSDLLRRVEITTGDFAATLRHAAPHTLFYLDPPYRPLSTTSYFNDYTAQKFDDGEQQRLRDFCDAATAAGAAVMLSNSDGKTACGDDYLDRLYARYDITRVMAARCVNATGTGRGKIAEIVARNFSGTTSPRLL